MAARRPPRLAAGVRAKPPPPPGLTFVHAIVCLGCGHRWRATYRDPPERFRCPACGKREGVRDLPATTGD